MAVPEGVKGVAPLLRKQPWLGAPGPSQAPGFFAHKDGEKVPQLDEQDVQNLI